MTIESPRIRSLLRQADSVASVGKRAAAEQLYRQIIDEAPETAEAWHGLAQVTRSEEEREAALSRAAALNPEYGSTAGPAEDAPVAADEMPAEVEDESTFSKDGHGPVEQDVKAKATPEVAAEMEASDRHVHEPVEVGSKDAGADTVALYCANHPDRKTHLRCNRCGKPICSSCANPTPVGYRCPECIREQEDIYYTATPIDYVVATLVALPLAIVAGWIATLIGFWSIFLAAFAGTLIGRVAFRAARRRRGRWLPQLVVACVIIGGLLPALPLIIGLFFGQLNVKLLFIGIYLVMATGATYYQMR